MSSQDKLGLIFKTDIMNEVKTNIEKLDGEIYIESKKGQGSKFTIVLPLTLAITEALMVKINKEIFAIPLNAISEILKIETKNIKQVKGNDVILLRDETISLIDGKKSLNMNVEYNLYKTKKEISVVIINNGGNPIGLIVDELLYQQEIVIKSLSDYLENVKNISGATIIGDGEVALILDVKDIA